MRMTASWSGHYRPTEYKVVARDDPAPDGKAPPLIIVPITTSVPPCSGLSRRGLETTERAEGRATADLDRPCARRPQHVWVGAKKRDSKSNKETGMKERVM